MIRLLLPVDGSKNAERAVRVVANCYPRLAPIEVRLLYVRVSDAVPPESLGERSRGDALEFGSQALKTAESMLVRVGVPCLSEIREGYVPSVIARFGKEMDCDVIVMGTRGMGSSDQLLGSIARQVINLADIPVTLIK